MIAKKKAPEGLEDFESLRVNNFKAQMINDMLSLGAGLNLAIDSVNAGEITKKAREALSQLTAQSCGLSAYRIAHNVLLEEGLIEKEAVTDLLYRFDLPDDTHDDLVIYYKKRD